MAEQINILNDLLAFKNREKFSVSEWSARGLNPSDKEMCSRLELGFNLCADDLIEAVKSGAGQKQLKSILREFLNNFDKSNLDTEAREFVCDNLMFVSEIVSIYLKDDLTKWLYGSV